MSVWGYRFACPPIPFGHAGSNAAGLYPHRRASKGDRVSGHRPACAEERPDPHSDGMGLTMIVGDFGHHRDGVQHSRGLAGCL